MATKKQPVKRVVVKRKAAARTKKAAVKKKVAASSGSAKVAVGASGAKPVEFDDAAGVDGLVAGMEAAVRPLVERIRAVVLKVEEGITEGVKWNSPSFYREGWFATMNLRGKAGVMLVLHHGAKAHAGAGSATRVKDETGLLRWHGDDRATVTFASEADFEGKRKAFEKVMKNWLSAH